MIVVCKQIRETPHKRHHKFIEFYDVRAAEAALKGLNRSEIAGKRIKLEPSRPGGARRKCVHVFQFILLFSGLINKIVAFSFFQLICSIFPATTVYMIPLTEENKNFPTSLTD